MGRGAGRFYSDDELAGQSGMNDRTFLYYSANVIDEKFLNAIIGRQRFQLFLLQMADQVVSVTQKPVNFGKNICVGEIGASVYNVYKQILIGAKTIKTKFTVCLEDDTLYSDEHLIYEPSPLTFAYNKNRWIIDPDPIFRYRNRTGMCMCIVETSYLVDVLEEKFEKYPDPLDGKLLKGWGEPGRYEKNLGLPPVHIEYFKTTTPCVHFNHKKSLRGVRSKNPTDILTQELQPWGYAGEVWKEYHG
jgi:hypothetical protein